MMDAADCLNRSYGLSSVREEDGRLVMSCADYAKLCASFIGKPDIDAPLSPIGCMMLVAVEA